MQNVVLNVNKNLQNVLKYAIFTIECEHKKQHLWR